MWLHHSHLPAQSLYKQLQWSLFCGGIVHLFRSTVQAAHLWKLVERMSVLFNTSEAPIMPKMKTSWFSIPMEHVNIARHLLSDWHIFLFIFCQRYSQSVKSLLGLIALPCSESLYIIDFNFGFVCAHTVLRDVFADNELLIDNCRTRMKINIVKLSSDAVKKPDFGYNCDYAVEFWIRCIVLLFISVFNHTPFLQIALKTLRREQNFLEKLASICARWCQHMPWQYIRAKCHESVGYELSGDQVVWDPWGRGV